MSASRKSRREPLVKAGPVEAWGLSESGTYGEGVESCCVGVPPPVEIAAFYGCTGACPVATELGLLSVIMTCMGLL